MTVRHPRCLLEPDDCCNRSIFKDAAIRVNVLTVSREQLEGDVGVDKTDRQTERERGEGGGERGGETERVDYNFNEILQFAS